ncbi:hypothetical protein K3758_08160 [Sulfitobacter sp. W002]|uniref:hypothetical protein n=1 Tax=Sulfitobacter sp. W002 TaxID=2867024 RepID=UPI0021A3281B|nr:hypothetical protein [Sulfitobacter sp. W002]UWR31461.1 hypothetical protein K3758_08160 [Sulfitobacter sp. W002]
MIMLNSMLSEPLNRDLLRRIDAIGQENVPVNEWRVSSRSVFADDEWIMDGTAMESERKVRFSSPLPLNQPALTEPGYEGLLLDCKLVLWSSTVTKNGFTSGTKANAIFRYLRAIFAWMMRENISDFGYVTRDRVWADGGIDNPRTFAGSLLEHLGGKPEDIVASTPTNYLNLFAMIFREFEILRTFDRPCLPEHPFDTGESSLVANELGRKEMEEWRPIPDEVLIPMLNASGDWLGQRAEDVIEALSIFEDAKRRHVGREVGHRYATMLAKQDLATFQFSEIDGVPWHEPLDNYRDQETNQEQDQTIRQLGRLVRYVQAAGMIAIQQSSGMRSGELIELLSETRENNKAACIEEKLVSGGAKTLVIIHSVTTKINEGIPEAHQWIVGVKPSLPFGKAPDVLAQRAVDVLIQIGNLLKTPNTNPQVSKLLFVNWGSGGVPADGSALVRFTNGTHNEAIRQFLAHTCKEELSALPDDSPKLVQDGWLGHWRDSGGGILHSHQLRKAFANFAYSMEPGLREEIRVQYGHMSIAMTNRYTNNVHQIKQLNEMEAQLAAEHIVAALSQSALAGKGVEEVRQRGDWQELRERFDRANPEDRHQVVSEWLHETRRLVDEEYRIVEDGRRDLRTARRSAVSDAAHGLCAAVSIRADDMECRKDGDTIHRILDGMGADKRYRTPSRCLGCINYLVLPKHRPFWEVRYRRSQEIVAFMKCQNRPLSMYQAQLNVSKQSRVWLKQIGATEEELDAIAEDCIASALRKVANG